MNEPERLHALETALDNEMGERAFYMRHTARIKNRVGKAIFKKIGDEELEHCERLKELHARWEKQDKWPETAPLKVKDTLVKDVEECLTGPEFRYRRNEHHGLDGG